MLSDVGLTGHRWKVLGLGFRSSLQASPLQQETEALLEGFRGEGAARKVINFGLVRKGENLELFLEEEGQEQTRIRLGSEPAEEIVYHLISQAIDRVPARLVLHAACVSGPTGTCLAIGPAGAGKTTLSLALWREGMEILGDDIAPIAHDSLRPESFPRALRLDNPVPEWLASRIPARRQGFPSMYYPFPGRADVEASEVTTILVLEKAGSETGELVSLHQAEAAHAVLGAAIKTRDFSYAKALDTAMRLAAGARAFRLRSSSARGMVAVALELLGKNQPQIQA